MRFTKILLVCLGLVLLAGLQVNCSSRPAGLGNPLPSTAFLADGRAPLPIPPVMADGGAPLPIPPIIADGGAPLPIPPGVSVELGTVA